MYSTDRRKVFGGQVHLFSTLLFFFLAISSSPAQNVGVGTTTPAARLQVIGDLDVRTVVMSSGVALDQSNTVGSSNVQFDNHWQSFTAGVMGSLTRVDIYGANNTGGDILYDLKIFDGEGTGGTLLTTIAGVAWPAVTTGWTSYDLSSPVALTAGQKYTWQIIPDPFYTNTLTSYFQSSGNAYPGGISSWLTGDFLFRTYMFTESVDTVATLHADKGRVGIGTTTPDASAKLEIVSDTSGILIPRISAAARDDIASPATGLLVYVTGDNVFSYYDGTTWNAFGGPVTQIADTDTDTKLLVEKTSDEDTIFFHVAGTEYFRMVPGRLEVVNTGHSIFIGEGAGASDDFTDNENVFIGHEAGTLNSNTVGGNTLVGYRTGYNSSSSDATGVGAEALYNDSGSANTAVGHRVLYTNSTGSSNTGLGYQALYQNSTGSVNTAVGVSALQNATGSSNTGLGTEALIQSTGSDNVAMGYRSLYNNTTGSSNTAVGDSALISNTTGSNNTALGHRADVSTGNLNNATAIGNGATVNASDKIRLGGSSVTVIEGQVAYTVVSDARFKRNVLTDVPGLDFILRLEPVSYNFDRLAFARHIGEKTAGQEKLLRRMSERRSVGFLAQDVEKLVEESGFTAFDANHAPTNETDSYSLSYAHFVMPLVKAGQELATRNDMLESRIGERQELITTQQVQITALLQRIEALEAHTTSQTIK